ncbi:MAG: DUF4198 domain-containing protein [Planctomycetota bacterium]
MKRLIVLGGLAALALPALAHDMWLVPPVERGAPNEPVESVVAVGMDFPNSSSSIDPARMTTVAAGPGGARAEVALERDRANDRTLATFTPTAAGTWTLGATTKPRVLELEAAKFNDYLLHDGMPHVLADRMDRGDLDRDAVEQYSKYVKSIVQVGDAPDEPALPLGHTLEIVPIGDPLSAKVGGTLAARVLYEGKPLQRANLCWDHPGNGGDFSGQTWTDADGRAVVPVAKAGPMTLRLVHMTRPQTDEYEWESFWASFTFHVSGD